MVFKSQEDSFLKEFTSSVVSCVPTKFDKIINGKTTSVTGYEIICEDTILFPEGGGQPYDQGYLNNVWVEQVLRKGDKAVHYTTEPLQPGDVVKQKIVWERRFDHMQQHSGQHLVTGVILRDLGIKTVSWWLGEDVCHIELVTPMLSKEQIQKVEETVNELIRNLTNVTVKVFDKNSNDDEVKQARTRGLPDDHVGDIRVITINGVDSMMCCGTHVKNLSQLQVVKLLHSEKSKRKNNCLLYFLVGNRVLKYLEESLTRERKITTILNSGVSQHVDLIEKLSKNMKVTNKNLQIVLKDIAVYEAEKVKSLKPKYFCLHRKEAEPDFMNTIVREVGSTETFLCLSTGEEKGQGNVLLYGKEEDIKELGNKISEILSGKGAGKGNRYNAKVTKLGNRPQVEEILKEYFK